MRILATQYTLPLKSLDIYVAGCNGSPHCVGCHNSESWDFNQGDLYDSSYFQKIKSKVQDFDILIDNIMIFGGEPLDQDYDDLIDFLIDLNKLNKKIWIFTRYNIEDIHGEIKQLCDYIKCGRYDESLKTEDNIQYGITLATSNQFICKKGLDF